MAGVRIDHVPYKGGGQAIVDCIAGHIEICFIPATAAISHVKSKQLKPLGLTATSRWSEMPSTPTLDEAGVAGYNYVTWYGLFLPAKTPNNIVQKITIEVQKLMNDPDIKKTFKDQGLQLVTTNSGLSDKLLTLLPPKNIEKASKLSGTKTLGLGFLLFKYSAAL